MHSVSVDSFWMDEHPVTVAEFRNFSMFANKIAHPRSLYLREEVIVPHLDQWLARAFTPDHLEATVAALAEASDQGPNADVTAKIENARATIADCDQKLARYRAALESGTDPTLIATWTAEVNASKAAAQARIRAANPGRPQRMSTDEIRTLINSLGSIIKVLRDADPADKATIYANLGLTLTYQQAANTVIAEAKPSAIMYEGSCPRGEPNRDYMIRLTAELRLDAGHPKSSRRTLMARGEIASSG